MPSASDFGIWVSVSQWFKVIYVACSERFRLASDMRSSCHPRSLCARDGEVRLALQVEDPEGGEPDLMSDDRLEQRSALRIPIRRTTLCTALTIEERFVHRTRNLHRLREALFIVLVGVKFACEDSVCWFMPQRCRSRRSSHPRRLVVGSISFPGGAPVSYPRIEPQNALACELNSTIKSSLPPRPHPSFHGKIPENTCLRYSRDGDEQGGV